MIRFARKSNLINQYRQILNKNYQPRYNKYNNNSLWSVAISELNFLSIIISVAMRFSEVFFRSILVI